MRRHQLAHARLPDPAPWAVLLEDGIDATDVRVVDDQTCNLDAARSLGIMTVAAMGDCYSLTPLPSTDMSLAVGGSETTKSPTVANS